ncbi:hypothetical protein Hanom_Chr12g01175381 [Helianthus anomalus]
MKTGRVRLTQKHLFFDNFLTFLALKSTTFFLFDPLKIKAQPSLTRSYVNGSKLPPQNFLVL